jgi:hypothetical protein
MYLNVGYRRFAAKANVDAWLMMQLDWTIPTAELKHEQTFADSFDPYPSDCFLRFRLSKWRTWRRHCWRGIGDVVLGARIAQTNS